MKTVGVVIPVYRPGDELKNLIRALKKQTYPVEEIVLVETREGETGNLTGPDFWSVKVSGISLRDFDHAGTRNFGGNLCHTDYLLFFTQDVILEDTDFIRTLVDGLQETGASVSYARQLPRKDSSRIEALIREFNYPENSVVKTKEDLRKLGIKTYFCSDVACLYRKDIWEELGKFKEPAVFNEDMVFAYSVIQSGQKIFYNAKAKVIHSHRMTFLSEFHRNFDLGASQAMNREVFSNLSSTGEGKKLVSFVLRKLLRSRYFYQIPKFGFLCIAKYAGYRKGLRFETLPESKVRRCSGNKNFWRKYYGKN